MKDPVFLLQSGQVMTTEKTACCFSRHPVEYCKFEDLGGKSEGMLKYVPVGSVEFTEAYCDAAGIALPNPLSYYGPSLEYLYRSVRVKPYSECQDHEFVKPYNKVKLFTGGIKSSVEKEGFKIDPNEMVWVSNPVPFESEFRFYIHDFVTGPKIWGWSRYDELDVVNPEPDIGMVESLANDIHSDLGPGAYTIDIGWRPDIERYSLVELNDAWALGYYTHGDLQSNPPTRQQYSDMLVSRWTQILFCNIV